MKLTDRAGQETQPRLRSVESTHVCDLIRIGEAASLSPWSAESYLDEMKNPNAIIYRIVAENNSTIGFVVGRLITGGQTEPQREAEIYNIAVIEAERRKGLGQMLFDAFAKDCRDKEVTNVWLEVRESNRRAIAFYEKNGFKPVQTRSHFYENPREHAILMRLNLK